MAKQYVTVTLVLEAETRKSALEKAYNIMRENISGRGLGVAYWDVEMNPMADGVRGTYGGGK